MSSLKFAPLPWKAESEDSIVCTHPETGEGIQICKVGRETAWQLFGPEPNTSELRDFILQACNNFHDLVYACQQAQKHIQNTPTITQTLDRVIKKATYNPIDRVK